MMAAAKAQSRTGTIHGRITDAGNGEPLVGALAIIKGTNLGSISDREGYFTLQRLGPGNYTVEVSMIGFQRFVSEALVIVEGETVELQVSLPEEVNTMDDIIVAAKRPAESDAAAIAEMRQAKVALSGISAAQIARNQDKDAVEVVRRIPGISIVDDKFIIVRGLSQRYNNTWIKGAALPSSEADTRAFSFDIIPTSQIETIMIAKTPAAEYPADFSGGFVMIRTKIAEKNQVSISYGTGINSRTHSSDFFYAKGSPTDFLGFDNGMRALAGFVPKKINGEDITMVNRVTREGFGNNDWSINSRKPLPDQRINFSLGHSRHYDSGARFALTATAHYSLASKTISDMVNKQFGVYNASGDAPVTIFNYSDDIYTTDAKAGAMFNLLYAPKSKGKGSNSYEFRNMFNQLGRSRLTMREGWRDKSGFYLQYLNEYFYQSRSIYSGQWAGDHKLGDKVGSHIDWSAGYSYSNRYQPDRRIVERQKEPSNGIPDYSIFQSSVQRFYTALGEHMATGAVNYRLHLNPSASDPISLKTGLYSEYKARCYKTREFAYKWDMNNSLPSNFKSLSTERIFAQDNLGAPDKIHIQDETSNTNNYKASSTNLAAYAALDIPLGRFDIYAGLRFERMATVLTAYTRVSSNFTRDYHDNYNHIFPSVNASFDINEKSLFRFAYGMSVNRQEFRELSPSSYYDFDIFSIITGNPNLKQATVQNMDLRYELYPSGNETLSIALFYKHFNNPIEWYYIDAGGSIQYSFMNGDYADNYGIELDARKNLAFIGMRNFTAILNVSFIKSTVRMTRAGVEYERPMQGQSPYLINAGLFYQAEKLPLSLGLLYNRIGERIIGIGRVQGGDVNSFNNNLPDLYEQPRDLMDLSVSYKIGKIFEMRAAARDILAQKNAYLQYPKFLDPNGVMQTRTQVARSYSTGRNVQLTLLATF